LCCGRPATGRSTASARSRSPVSATRSGQSLLQPSRSRLYRVHDRSRPVWLTRPVQAPTRLSRLREENCDPKHFGIGAKSSNGQAEAAMEPCPRDGRRTLHSGTLLSAPSSVLCPMALTAAARPSPRCCSVTIATARFPSGSSPAVLARTAPSNLARGRSLVARTTETAVRRMRVPSLRARGPQPDPEFETASSQQAVAHRAYKCFQCSREEPSRNAQPVTIALRLLERGTRGSSKGTPWTRL
jgi:hypothetical protein